MCKERLERYICELTEPHERHVIFKDGFPVLPHGLDKLPVGSFDRDARGVISWRAPARIVALTPASRTQTTAQRDLQIGDPVSFIGETEVFYVREILACVGIDRKFYVQLDDEAAKAHVYDYVGSSDRRLGFVQSRLKLRHDILPKPARLTQSVSIKRPDDLHAEIVLCCTVCNGIIEQKKPHGAYTYPHDASQLREVQYFCDAHAESIAKHIAYLKSGHAKPERPQRDRARTSSWCPEDPDDLL